MQREHQYLPSRGPPRATAALAKGRDSGAKLPRQELQLLCPSAVCPWAKCSPSVLVSLHVNVGEGWHLPGGVLLEIKSVNPVKPFQQLRVSAQPVLLVTEWAKSKKLSVHRIKAGGILSVGG